MSAEERRPQTPPQQTRQSLETQATQQADIAGPRLTPFQCWLRFDCNRRRHEHSERKALYPWTPPPRSTFSLDPDELRRHANSLVLEHGWAVAEVRAVLDVDPARTP
jgi:hypothetical protein